MFRMSGEGTSSEDDCSGDSDYEEDLYAQFHFTDGELRTETSIHCTPVAQSPRPESPPPPQADVVILPTPVKPEPPLVDLVLSSDDDSCVAPPQPDVPSLEVFRQPLPAVSWASRSNVVVELTDTDGRRRKRPAVPSSSSSDTDSDSETNGRAPTLDLQSNIQDLVNTAHPKQRKRRRIGTLLDASVNMSYDQFYNSNMGAEFHHDTVLETMPDDANLWRTDMDDTGVFNHSARRYYRKGVRCLRCNQIGHLSKDCKEPRKPVVCCMCSKSGHISTSCPEIKCLNCGARTARFASSCFKCRKQSHETCQICTFPGHKKDKCPDLWRRYHSTTSSTRIVPAVPEYRDISQSYCSNCAEKGHLSHQCSKTWNSSYPPVWPCIVDYTDVYKIRKDARKPVSKKRSNVENNPTPPTGIRDEMLRMRNDEDHWDESVQQSVPRQMAVQNMSLGNSDIKRESDSNSNFAGHDVSHRVQASTSTDTVRRTERLTNSLFLELDADEWELLLSSGCDITYDETNSRKMTIILFGTKQERVLARRHLRSISERRRARELGYKTGAKPLPKPDPSARFGSLGMDIPNDAEEEEELWSEDYTLLNNKDIKNVEKTGCTVNVDHRQGIEGRHITLSGTVRAIEAAKVLLMETTHRKIKEVQRTSSLACRDDRGCSDNLWDRNRGDKPTAACKPLLIHDETIDDSDDDVQIISVTKPVRPVAAVSPVATTPFNIEDVNEEPSYLSPIIYEESLPQSRLSGTLHKFLKRKLSELQQRKFSAKKVSDAYKEAQQIAGNRSTTVASAPCYKILNMHLVGQRKLDSATHCNTLSAMVERLASLPGDERVSKGTFKNLRKHYNAIFTDQKTENLSSLWFLYGL